MNKYLIESLVIYIINTYLIYIYKFLFQQPNIMGAKLFIFHANEHPNLSPVMGKLFI